MPRKKLPPITPGEVLLEEFLKPLEVSQYQLAKDVSVPPRNLGACHHPFILPADVQRVSRLMGFSSLQFLVRSSALETPSSTNCGRIPKPLRSLLPDALTVWQRPQSSECFSKKRPPEIEWQLETMELC